MVNRLSIHPRKSVALCLAAWLAAGCSSLPTLQRMAYLPRVQETIGFTENNSGAEVTWTRQVNPAKSALPKAPSANDAGPLYVIESAPIVAKDKLFIHDGGNIVELDPQSGKVNSQHDLGKLFNTDVVVDEYREDPAGNAFSFAYNYEFEKYVLLKDNAEVAVQRYGRGDSPVDFLEYHRGKLIVGTPDARLFLFDAFSDTLLWIQPIQSMKEGRQSLKPPTDFHYQRLAAVVFDKDSELLCALYQTKRKNYFLEAYNFADGKSLWKKSLASHFPGQDTAAKIFLHHGKLVVTETPLHESPTTVNPINHLLEMRTGQEVLDFQGVYGVGWRGGKDSIYYARYDRETREWQGLFRQGNAGAEQRVTVENLDPSFGIQEIADGFIYLTRHGGETNAVITTDDGKVHLSGFDGIGKTGLDFAPRWHVNVGSQKALPAVYEKEGVLVLGDPLGNGKTSDLVWLDEAQLSDTVTAIDIRSGKVLWKATVPGGKIARVAVWENMAFIKTLHGTLFAVRWRKS